MEFTSIIILVILILGVSTLLWSGVGLIRWTAELAGRRRPAAAGGRAMRPAPHPEDVAVLIAAHNEAVVISDTIRTAEALVPRTNIHVISDGSTDATAAIARSWGVNVLELTSNRGKAGALEAGIGHFDLCRRYEVVLLLDADTRLAPDYLETGLPLFQDPDVVAVAGRAKSQTDASSLIGRLLIAYRERLYAVVQLLFKYGQAARKANVVSIVPGFASMYRTSALQHIEIAASGLVIEDFNMTFEVHARRLGRIAFHPGAAVAYTQDPNTFEDYVRQIRRWNLGFWQTVRRHGLHVGRFWAALALHIVELLVSAVVLVLLLPVFLLSLAAGVLASWTAGTGGLEWAAGLLPPEVLLLGILLPDLALTIVAAVALRRPGLLILAPVFPVLRIVDAAVCLSALPQAWSARSSGAWTSPARRAQVQQPAPARTTSSGLAMLDSWLR